MTTLASASGGEAAGDQCIRAQKVLAGGESLIDVEPQEALTLKGFRRPVSAYRVRGLKA